MKQAIIILAHKNPAQLKRLTEALKHPYFDIFIHIDKQVKIEPFRSICSIESNNIQFIANRSTGKWGDIGIVQGTLNALREILDRQENYSHVHLISGQDYPIKSTEKIHSFFKEHVNTDFLEFEPFPVKHMPFGGMQRIKYHSFNINGKRHTFLPFKYCENLSLKGKFMNSFLGMLQVFLPKRKIPYNLVPYFGSQWWSLSLATIQKIIDFVDSHPAYLQFHKFSLLPDEMFFQTIIANFPTPVSLKNDNKRFILWNSESSHPISLSSLQLAEIKGSDKMFARKFEENTPILKELDETINS